VEGQNNGLGKWRDKKRVAWSIRAELQGDGRMDGLELELESADL